MTGTGTIKPSRMANTEYEKRKKLSKSVQEESQPVLYFGNATLSSVSCSRRGGGRAKMLARPVYWHNSYTHSAITAGTSPKYCRDQNRRQCTPYCSPLSETDISEMLTKCYAECHRYPKSHRKNGEHLNSYDRDHRAMSLWGLAHAHRELWCLGTMAFCTQREHVARTACCSQHMKL